MSPSGKTVVWMTKPECHASTTQASHSTQRPTPHPELNPCTQPPCTQPFPQLTLLSHFTHLSTTKRHASVTRRRTSQWLLPSAPHLAVFSEGTHPCGLGSLICAPSQPRAALSPPRCTKGTDAKNRIPSWLMWEPSLNGFISRETARGSQLRYDFHRLLATERVWHTGPGKQRALLH